MELCFFCFKGKLGVYAVALIDVAIGFITSILTIFVIIYSTILKNQSFVTPWTEADYVKWFGLLSIMLVGVFEVVTGCTLFSTLCRGGIPQRYFWKSFLYVLVELIGFITPFLIVPNYNRIIDELIANNSILFILFLLKINPLTIILFLYQVYSFFVVRNYQKSSQMKLKRPTKTDRSRRIEIPLLPLVNQLNDACGVRSSGPGEVTKPYLPVKSTNDNVSEGKPGLKEGGVNGVIVPRKGLYPSLGDFQLEPLGNTLTQILITNGRGQPKVFAIPIGQTIRKLPIRTEFHRLREIALKHGELYHDPDFPATATSMGMKIKGKNVNWKRPHEICESPAFFTNGISRFDVNQGSLGNCWFVAALANLTLREDIFYQVVPQDNEVDFYDEQEYAGIFHFRFYFGGEWVEVIIDDRLPTANGKLIFAHSSDQKEFWSCLLEKAYAKFKGSYKTLVGGRWGSAMQDFTGIPSKEICLNSGNILEPELFKRMDSSLKTGNFLGAGIHKDLGAPLKNGLFRNHAYSITGVKEVKLQNRVKLIKLVRIRNPWGNGFEWKGDWCDRHPLWSHIDKATKKELKVLFEDDGEFWLPMNDFIRFFDSLEICFVVAK